MFPQKKSSPIKHWINISKSNVNPAWFTCIMGTGILAICIVKFPHPLPFFPILGSILWGFNILLFTIFLLLWLLRTIQHPLHIRDSLLHPLQAQQWGSPPTACFTIATGSIFIGDDLLGTAFSIVCAHILWIIGVLGSLFSAMFIPYLMFTRHKITVESTYGSFLVPIAPIIGASIPASLLASFWPEPLQVEIMLLSFILWGSGITLAGIIIVLFYARLTYHKVPEGVMLPSMWLVIGPLGQSIAGINAIGTSGKELWPAIGDTLHTAGLIYSIPIWGISIYWLSLTILITVHAARKHLPFNISWWAFIYPLGVLTTATYSLYEHVPTLFFSICCVVLTCLLIFLWIFVAIRTSQHALQHITIPTQASDVRKVVQS
jgi:C4-dicarboxylate transporter/malic acid transport protein